MKKTSNAIEKFSFGLFIICTIVTILIYSLAIVLQNNRIPTIASFDLIVSRRLNASVNYVETLEKSVAIEHLNKAPNVYLSRNPYAYDKYCRNFTKRLFQPGTLDVVPLVSYPGSGNTWIRHLIELGSGIYTGSIYMDIDILAKGFLGEKEPWDSGSTIVQKMHVNYTKELNVHKGILLIRNPYEAIWSFVQFQSSGHTGRSFIGKSKFKSKEWSNYALGQTYKWISLYKSWIESPITLLILTYEDLISNPIEQIKEICNFLEIGCSNLNATCFHNHKEGTFHRKKMKSKQSITIKPIYESWVIDKIDGGINYLNTLLLVNGYKGLPIARYKYNTGAQE